MPKLSKSFVNQIKDLTYKDKTFTDDEIKKLAIRIQGKKKSWILTYRMNGKQEKMTLGSIFERTPDDVRAEAIELIDMINKGINPKNHRNKNNNILNVSELCDLYMAEGVAHKKESTLKIDQGRITHHIKPIIGNIRLSELNTGDIERMMIKIMNGNVKSAQEQCKIRGRSRVTGGHEAANRTVQLLSAIFNFAINRELLDKNPAKFVKRPKTQAKETFLTPQDIKLLGVTLKRPSYCDKKEAINAIKLLLLTGCRKDEILSLRWDFIDFDNQCFRFPDTKTGKQNRVFGTAALKLLKELQSKNPSPWVFPATKGSGHYIGLPKIFNRICSSKLEDDFADNATTFYKPDITLHSLRHTFASISNLLGYNDFTIAGMLGHHIRSTTARYSHNVDSALISAANQVSEYINNLLEGYDNELISK